MFGRLGGVSVTGATTAAFSPEHAENVKADATARAITGAEIRISKDLREIMQAQKKTKRRTWTKVRRSGSCGSQTIYSPGTDGANLFLCVFRGKWRGDYTRV